jgi:hypothetical protein
MGLAPGMPMTAPKREATYNEEDGLSLAYIYVTPEDEFPAPEDLVSVARNSELVLDFQRSTGKLLGIEVITSSQKDSPENVGEVEREESIEESLAAERKLAEDLANYVGKWVALKNHKVVANARTLEELKGVVAAQSAEAWLEVPDENLPMFFVNSNVAAKVIRSERDETFDLSLIEDEHLR